MLVALGLTQCCATISDRERLVVPPEELSGAIQGFAGLGGVDEIVLLSTCYRVEVYAASRCPAAAALAIRQALAQRAGRDLPWLELHGSDALRHLFRVASSLESAVIGEPQILGQVKDAHARAVEAGAAGVELGRVMSRAFEVAKRVRTETAIGRAAISWGHAAVALAEKVFGDITGRRVVILGAGEMARLSARHLRERGAEIAVVNRTLANAEALAVEVNGTARGLDALEEEIRGADVLVSAAPVAPPCLEVASMAALMRARHGRPLVLVDLAVPRAIGPGVGKIEGCYVCDVDDLARLSRAALAERSAAVAAAERMIEEELARWTREEAERRAAPIIRAMRSRASEIAREEVERTLRRLGEDPELATRLNALAGAIVSKLLHVPSARLRQAGQDGPSGEALMAAAMQMFDVPPENQLRVAEG